MNTTQIQNKITTLKNQLLREENIASYHRSELERSEEKVESLDSEITVLEGQLLKIEDFEENQKEEAEKKLNTENGDEYDDHLGTGMDTSIDINNFGQTQTNE